MEHFQNGRLNALIVLNILPSSRQDKKVYLKTLRKPSSWNDLLKKEVRSGRVDVQKEIRELEKQLGLEPGEEVY
jgi:hypothetical protein